MSLYQVGNVVLFEGRVGIIRFCGNLFDDGNNNDKIFAGIETFLSDSDFGDCDGSFNNIRYFDCPPNHGMFLPTKQIERLIGTQELLEKLALQMRQNQDHSDICNKLYSKTLYWYYNRLSKRWDIVHKTALSNTNNNANVCVVRDCNGKRFVANKVDLYDRPPTDELSLTQVIELTMKVFSQSMKNNARSAVDKNVNSVCMCE